MKTVLLWIAVVLFGGCEHFTVNGTICDQLQNEPNTQNIPKECRKYNEEDAKKAFFKEKKSKKSDIDDVIEFTNKGE